MGWTEWTEKLRRAVGRGPYTPPQTVIGTCALCRKTAQYADSHTYLGQPEHFACTKRASANAVVSVMTTNAFARIREQLRAAPELERSLDREMVIELTREFTVPNLLRLIAHIEERMASVKPVRLEPMLELSRSLTFFKQSFV